MSTLWTALRAAPDAPLQLRWEAALHHFVVHVGAYEFTTSPEETAQRLAAVPGKREWSPAEQQRAWQAARWALSYVQLP